MEKQGVWVWCVRRWNYWQSKKFLTCWYYCVFLHRVIAGRFFVYSKNLTCGVGLDTEREWNVQYAKRGVNKQWRSLSRVMTNDSCAMPVWLSCGQRGWNTAKTARGIALKTTGEKTAFWEAVYQEITGYRRVRQGPENQEVSTLVVNLLFLVAKNFLASL